MFLIQRTKVEKYFYTNKLYAYKNMKIQKYEYPLTRMIAMIV